MEDYPITRIEGSLHIEGFPDAIKLIRLDDQARRISDLVLHRHDLEFADQCLDAINKVNNEPSVIKEALWRSALIHYAKCFGNSAARFQLCSIKIYKNESPESMQVFEYFLNLRNKHVVHDENSYAQIIPGAVLNKGDKAYKIEKILCLEVHADTLGQENYSNLKLLIQKALAWVIAEFDTCCAIVTKELEAISYDNLLSKEDVNFRIPTVTELGKNRRTKR